MNYYEHHIGDYAAATSHLSLIEDAVYTRMLRRYYLQEGPLPGDWRQVARLVGARAQDELDAVEAVLAEFFDLQDDGWHQKRADADIARYLEKQSKARASADARWGSKGTQCGGNANAMRTHSERNAHQTPDTSNQQEQEQRAGALPTKSRGTRLPNDWAPDPELLAWAKAARPDIPLATELDKFRDHWRSAPGSKGVKLDWAATFRNWIRNANSRGASNANLQSGRKLSAVEQVEQAIRNRRQREAGNEDGATSAIGYGRAVDADGEPLRSHLG